MPRSSSRRSLDGVEDGAGPRPGGGPRSWPSATHLFPDVLPAVAAALGGSRSLVARLTHDARSASPSGSISTNPSATSITSSPSTWRTCIGRCSTRSPTASSCPSSSTCPAPLLEWLEAHEAAYLDRLGRLAADGQVEILLAGFYEPVLASLPRRDRVEQIEWMREAVRSRFGVDAVGLWLTERVWEPELAADLADAGVRYALVDDRHFLVTGFRAEQLHAPFWTESDGKRVALFPIDERLRYLIPFRPPEETADYLRELRGAGHRLAVLADDGEKFGGWPGTKEWVYGAGMARPIHGDDRRAGRTTARSC